MSFARLALRIATAKALVGRTFAGDVVRDSEVGPIDDAAANAEVPYIAVYTDDCEVVPSTKNEAPGLVSGESMVSLTIEIGVTTRMKPKSTRQGDSAFEWVIPTTDPGMELTIDAMERQVRVALADPASVWGEMWRKLALHVTSEKSQRGASAKDGVRFAGRQIVLMVQVPADPPAGAPLTGRWARFLELVNATPDLAPRADVFELLATGGSTDASDLARMRASLGLTAQQVQSLQLTAPASIDPDQPNFADVVTTDVDDTVSAP